MVYSAGVFQSLGDLCFLDLSNGVTGAKRLEIPLQTIKSIATHRKVISDNGYRQDSKSEAGCTKPPPVDNAATGLWQSCLAPSRISTKV